MPETEKGWECPKCHTVYAPTVKECPKCVPPKNEETKPDSRQLLLEDTSDVYLPPRGF